MAKLVRVTIKHNLLPETVIRQRLEGYRLFPSKEESSLVIAFEIQEVLPRMVHIGLDLSPISGILLKQIERGKLKSRLEDVVNGKDPDRVIICSKTLGEMK